MSYPHDPTAALRRMVYAVLTTVAVAMACGRIASTQLVLEPDLHGPPPLRKWPTSPPQPMPSYSSNDRSRWCTVRSLVDEGTYIIGRRDPERRGGDNKYGDYGIVFEDGWGTVDKVLHPEKKEFYSTKPPLLATLVAGEYWLLKQTLGWEIADREHPYRVMRTILFTINGVGWLVYLLLLAWLIERHGTTDFGRLFAFSAGAFGTLMTPFLVTFNNHTPAAVCVLAVLVLLSKMGLLQPGEEERPTWWGCALAGLLAGFTAVIELPAASFTALVGVWLLWRTPRLALLGFLPALLLPVLAHFGTNYAAIGELTPAYDKFGGPWYQYEGSHWVPAPGKRGIDWAANYETRGAYAFHLLLGHHGLFSLTPIFLLSMAGLVQGTLRLVSGVSPSPPTPLPRFGGEGSPKASLPYVGVAGLLLSVVVVGFYLFKSDNYGGWTAGPRWLMWLTPIWLMAMLPIVDRLAARRWGRVLACGLLALSVFAMSYPAWNPWRHPWIYNWMESHGWIPY